MNYMRTAILLAGLTALFMGVGYLIGGEGGAMIALIVAAGMNLFSYWNSDKLVLAMHGAHEVDANARRTWWPVRDLAQRAGLPMPRVYVMDNPQPNAFATGRNPENAAVAVTAGLIHMLTRDELAGVIAHELAHISNRDTLIMTITATIAGAISMLAQFGLFFGGPSRKQPRPRHDRHHRHGHPRADRGHAGADGDQPHPRIRRRRAGRPFTEQPDALASALAKISSPAQQIENPTAERNPATAHLFIINPLTHGGIDNLFSTHPSTENRIAALQRLAADGAWRLRRPRGRSGLCGPTGRALGPPRAAVRGVDARSR